MANLRARNGQRAIVCHKFSQMDPFGVTVFEVVCLLYKTVSQCDRLKMARLVGYRRLKPPQYQAIFHSRADRNDPESAPLPQESLSDALRSLLDRTRYEFSSLSSDAPRSAVLGLTDFEVLVALNDSFDERIGPHAVLSRLEVISDHMRRSMRNFHDGGWLACTHMDPNHPFLQVWASVAPAGVSTVDLFAKISQFPGQLKLLAKQVCQRAREIGDDDLRAQGARLSDTADVLAEAVAAGGRFPDAVRVTKDLRRYHSFFSQARSVEFHEKYGGFTLEGLAVWVILYRTFFVVALRGPTGSIGQVRCGFTAYCAVPTLSESAVTIGVDLNNRNFLANKSAEASTAGSAFSDKSEGASKHSALSRLTKATSRWIGKKKEVSIEFDLEAGDVVLECAAPGAFFTALVKMKEREEKVHGPAFAGEQALAIDKMALLGWDKTEMLDWWASGRNEE